MERSIMYKANTWFTLSVLIAADLTTPVLWLDKMIIITEGCRVVVI